jgi:haemagglutination activity domain.
LTPSLPSRFLVQPSRDFYTKLRKRPVETRGEPVTTNLSELRLRPCWILLAMLATVGSVRAEVVLPGGGAPLTGNIEITQGMGTTQGGNLFHSFSVFNVLTGESVFFRGQPAFTTSFPGSRVEPAPLPVSNPV